MKFDYLLNFTISGLVEIGSKCFTHCTKDRVYLQLVFYGERESRNFESFFLLVQLPKQSGLLVASRLDFLQPQSITF